jgi:predicted CoA-binding protein
VHALIVEREEDLAAIVRGMRTVAVVGIKGDDRPDESAHSIPAMLVAQGLEVIGINPTVPVALGHPTLAGVDALTAAVDVLDVFRRSDAIPALADQLVALPAERRPRTVWLQSGIRHDEAAARLAAAGMRVVQDRCLGVYVRRYA